MKKYGDDVRLVYKHAPLPFHNRAMPAAKAAAAAHIQGKFWEYHDKLFANQQALGDADLERYAKEVGLDIEKWKKDKEGSQVAEWIKLDQAAAQEVNARGTPNFFVNGRNLRGALPFEDFDALVEEELAKAKKLVESGTPRDKLYETIIAKGKVFEPLGEKVNNFTLDGRPWMVAKDGDIVLFVAFGGGLTWGATAVRW